MGAQVKGVGNRGELIWEPDIWGQKLHQQTISSERIELSRSRTGEQGGVKVRGFGSSQREGLAY